MKSLIAVENLNIGDAFRFEGAATIYVRSNSEGIVVGNEIKIVVVWASKLRDESRLELAPATKVEPLDYNPEEVAKLAYRLMKIDFPSSDGSYTHWLTYISKLMMACCKWAVSDIERKEIAACMQSDLNP